MSSKKNTSRLIALDVFRGIIMLLLIAEPLQLYMTMIQYFEPGSLGFRFMAQFNHHPWSGLHFWDVIQPCFIFLVGIAIPFSMQKRLDKGGGWLSAFRHICYRSAWLFFLGLGLQAVHQGALVWELWNLLTQLSFALLFAFLLMNVPNTWQLAISIGVLVFMDIAYRSFAPDAPFSKAYNLGYWSDLFLMGKTNEAGGWVSINALPLGVCSLWGVMVGNWILDGLTTTILLRRLAALGGALTIAGFIMHFGGLTPINSYLATSSFVLVSGGIATLTFMLVYWIVEIRGAKDWTLPFVMVGMNPIFIYLFAQTIGKQWLVGFVAIFNDGILGVIINDLSMLDITNSMIALWILWFLCAFLFKNRLFFKV